MGRRRRSLRRLLALPLLAAAVLLAGCSAAPKPIQTADPSDSTVTPTESAPPVTGGGPPVPATGAYVGAWVQPTVYTQAGYEDATKSFETVMGRQLDIVHVYHKWTDTFPSLSDQDYAASGSYLMISWAGTNTRSIASGAFDAMIRERADAIKALGVPVFLEWRWEMDRPNLATQVLSGPDYIAAWIHIRKIFSEEAVTNVSWVWCPTATGFADGRAAAYYPGNSQVDWVCADAYPGSTNTSLADLMAPALKWASGHDKPVMIGEFGVRKQASDVQADWVADAAAWAAATPAIKALVYFDADYVDTNGHLSPMALQTSAASIRSFRAVLADPYFNPQRRRVAPTG